MELLINRLVFPQIDRLHDSAGLMFDDSARLLLVIKARGVFIFSLALFGLFSLVALSICGGTRGILFNVNIFPLLFCFIFTCSYNLLFYVYRNRAYFNIVSKYMQTLLDMCAAFLALFLADGLHSWLWVTFIFITLEVAFLFKSIRSVIYICVAHGIIYGLIIRHGAGTLFYLYPSTFYYSHGIFDLNVYYKVLAWTWVVVLNAIVGIIAAKSFAALSEREVSLKHLAAKDVLTGLYNQGYFLEAIKSELQRSLRYNHSFAFLMIDLDNFKKFNDTYGHQEGNRLLRCVGDILNTSIRRSGDQPAYDIDIACRFGGEEFAIILPEVQHVNEAYTVAERIRTKIEQLDLDGKRTSASIGLSMFPMDGKSAADIVNSADRALYEAKRKGKNCVVVAQSDLLRPSLHVVKKVSTSC